MEAFFVSFRQGLVSRINTPQKENLPVRKWANELNKIVRKLPINILKVFNILSHQGNTKILSKIQFHSNLE